MYFKRIYAEWVTDYYNAFSTTCKAHNCEDFFFGSGVPILKYRIWIFLHVHYVFYEK